MLDDALHFKQLEMLERAVDLVETKRVTRHMYAKIEEAKETIERLKGISQMMHKVLSLDQRTISEIRGYSNPSPEIHAVMKATLLLLGHFEEETRVCEILQWFGKSLNFLKTFDVIRKWSPIYAVLARFFYAKIYF